MSCMSTDNTKRQPAGIPVGGQFASHDRADAQITLPTGPPRAQLEGFIVALPHRFDADREPLPAYPAGLAEPKLSYVYGDDHPSTIYLSAEIDGVRVTVWLDEQGDRGDSINDSEEETGYDLDTDEQLLEWLHEARERIDITQHAVNMVSLDAFHDKVLAVALGTAEEPNTPTPVLKVDFDYDDPAAVTAHNADRAHRMLAAAGLLDQGDITQGAIETGIRDAVANLRHLADRYGIDFDEVEDYAQRMADDEREGRL